MRKTTTNKEFKERAETWMDGELYGRHAQYQEDTHGTEQWTRGYM